jgi:hypothetical protein
MSISLSCSTTAFREGMKHLSVALPRKKKELIASQLELNIRPNNLTLSTIGATYHIDCSANGFAKVILPTMLLLKIVKALKSETLSLECAEGEIKCDGFVISSDSISVVHPENQSSIDLSMNYTLVDLLRLRISNTDEELERMNLLHKVRKAQSDLSKNIHLAHELLKDYGVRIHDLEGLVESKVKSGNS